VTGPYPGEPAPPEALAAWILSLPPAPALPAGPRVVAVDGRSGAGKSTLAGSIADAVRQRRAEAVVVHLDDFYPGWDGLDPVVQVVVEHVLSPLAGTLPVVVPTWDWDADRPGPEKAVPALGPPRPAVVLLEGAGSGARAAAPWLAGLLWIDADPALRRARALGRDGAAYAPHWNRWSAQEESYAARERPRERAGLVLDTTGELPVAVR
jgi:energy-coupling factor transporter ATP-binding protein EcfA2